MRKHIDNLLIESRRDVMLALSHLNKKLEIEKISKVSDLVCDLLAVQFNLRGMLRAKFLHCIFSKDPIGDNPNISLLN